MANIRGTEALVPGTEAIIPGTDALVPGTEAIIPGTDALVPGTKAIIPGTEALIPGTDALVPGTEAIIPGTDALVNGTEAIIPGTGALASAEAIELPALFTMSLRLGGGVCSQPMIDREFGMIDFFLVSDVGDMTEKYRRMFISAHALVGLKIVDVQGVRVLPFAPRAHEIHSRLFIKLTICLHAILFLLYILK